MTTSNTNRTDLYQEVTHKIIAAIEAGSVPWACPWNRSGGGLPFNFSTDNQYSSINVLLLWMQALEVGFGSNAWLTMEQANKLGGHVRKGESSTRIVFYKMWRVEDEEAGSDSAENGESATKVIPLVKTYRVFNLDQIEGIDSGVPNVPTPSIDLIEKAVLFAARTGAEIGEGGIRAYYNRTHDRIQMPDRTRFQRPEDFHATLHHELIHWTGHKSRLDRTFGERFGDNAYAVEELVAELGSAFVNADLGIGGDVQGHASYLEHWLSVLKADKYALFRAAGDTSKAHKHLISLQSVDVQPD